MLVLSRKKDESIIIGDNVEITIVEIKGDAVRIGIKAPQQISVHRKEVYEAIQNENKAAAGQKAVLDATAFGTLGNMLKSKKPQ